jgi:hypothetical protein
MLGYDFFQLALWGIPIYWFFFAERSRLEIPSWPEVAGEIFRFGRRLPLLTCLLMIEMGQWFFEGNKFCSSGFLWISSHDECER